MTIATSISLCTGTRKAQDCAETFQQLKSRFYPVPMALDKTHNSHAPKSVNESRKERITLLAQNIVIISSPLVVQCHRCLGPRQSPSSPCTLKSIPNLWVDWMLFAPSTLAYTRMSNRKTTLRASKTGSGEYTMTLRGLAHHHSFCFINQFPRTPEATRRESLRAIKRTAVSRS